MNKVCYGNSSPSLPPPLLRSDFCPSVPGLASTQDLFLLELIRNKQKQRETSPVPFAPINPLANSSVALVEQVLRQCGSWDFSEVRAFLIQHLGVCQALIAALPHIEEVFGNGTNVNLQVLIDHDADGQVILNALIQTPDSVDAAIEKRRQFNKQWWSSARRLVKNLNFDIDCV